MQNVLSQEETAALNRSSIKVAEYENFEARKVEKSGETFFVNTTTGEASFERPDLVRHNSDGQSASGERDEIESLPENDELIEEREVGPLTEQELKIVMEIPGNDSCADCGVSHPNWASLSHGTLICMTCSGLHRGLGVHISFVRSIDLDNWTSDQYKRLLSGGNGQFQEFLTAKGGSSSGQRRYSEKICELYRLRLDAISMGNEPPETLPEASRSRLSMAESQSMARKSHRLDKPEWMADKDAPQCVLCERPFSFVFRRHHCRACGKVVCSVCAPSSNSKPIVKHGFMKPVRHCYECYQSPFCDWTWLGGKTRVGKKPRKSMAAMMFQRFVPAAAKRNSKSSGM